MTEAEAIDQLEAQLARFFDLMGVRVAEVDAPPLPGSISHYVPETKTIQICTSGEGADRKTRLLALLRQLGYSFGAQSPSAMQEFLCEFCARFLSMQAYKLLNPDIAILPSTCGSCEEEKQA
jgi:hypothetical protein